VTGWLLDTNVLSAFALGKPAISPKTTTWFNERSEELFLPAITAAKIEASPRGRTNCAIDSSSC
jgi:hypothetical protein